MTDPAVRSGPYHAWDVVSSMVSCNSHSKALKGKSGKCGLALGHHSFAMWECPAVIGREKKEHDSHKMIEHVSKLKYKRLSSIIYF